MPPGQSPPKVHCEEEEEEVAGRQCRSQKSGVLCRSDGSALAAARPRLSTDILMSHRAT